MTHCAVPCQILLEHTALCMKERNELGICLFALSPTPSLLCLALFCRELDLASYIPQNSANGLPTRSTQWETLAYVWKLGAEKPLFLSPLLLHLQQRQSVLAGVTGSPGLPWSGCSHSSTPDWPWLW